MENETITRHLQKVILSITKDIDTLCIKNNIEYFLLGGSAIGAIRHKGFIPWDDDLDIIMSTENYNRFLKICNEQLDKEKYYIQVGQRDWPLLHSKIKLKGTHLKEYEGVGDSETDGIFVDIFKMDNVSNNIIMAHWQYFCAKLHLSYQLSLRTYRSATWKKKVLMIISFPLKWSLLRKWVINQVEQYNNKQTGSYGFFYGRTVFSSGVISKKLYGKPTYVPFEDTQLPVPEHYHEYLTQVFGDYMKLPPEEKRVGMHLIDVEFGEY